MRKLDFKYLRAKNFLCFGEEEIIMHLKNYGNIVLVKGENLDDSDEETGRFASNGSGKSTIAEILSYTIYGKTIKKPKKISHKNVINNQSKKGLRTEVRIDNFRIVRTRSKDSLRLWVAPSDDFDWDDWIENKQEELDNLYEETLGGIPATQDLINKIIGITYETFINTVVFDDKNDSALECDTTTKRQITENLLGLEKYREYNDNAKELRKQIKSNITLLAKEYEKVSLEFDVCKKRVEAIDKEEFNWLQTKKKEILDLRDRAVSVQKELESSDIGLALSQYEEAQTEMNKLNENLPKLQEERSVVDNDLEIIKDKVSKIKHKKHDIEIEVKTINSQIKNSKNIIEHEKNKINRLNNLEEGVKCDNCYGYIEEKNYKNAILHSKNVISGEEGTLRKLADQGSKQLEKLDQCDTLLKEFQESTRNNEQYLLSVIQKIGAHRDRVGLLSSIEKPEVTTNELLLKNQLEEIERQVDLKKEEIKGSPYVSIKDSALKEQENKEAEYKAKGVEIHEAEAKLPYYDFWLKAFGDDGIRKFVVEGIIPALNTRLAYWLQYLIDSKIIVLFDNTLEETITRNPSNGNPFIYYAMSGGERRRLNLAVSQAFANIMTLRCGTSPSVIFLDEVELNVDALGIEGIYNMIMEISREKQVFIATHNQKLLDLLEGCNVLKLRKKDGFTKVVE